MSPGGTPIGSPTKRWNERNVTLSKSKEYKSPADDKKVSKSPLQSFMSSFTWESFKRNPDLWRKRISDSVNKQIRHAHATIGQLRYLEPQLHKLDRQLGFANMKCRTQYERLLFIKELRKHADQVLGNFDLSLGKTIDEVVSEAPPLLKSSVRLYQTRWRKAIATSKWQQDIDKAKENMERALERYKKCEEELETKRIHLELYKEIRDIKGNLDGLNDEDKLQKIERCIQKEFP
ncbi:hypothetical protein KIN20_003260 [Parelaphostrongylus tenuis]|uniref:Uncharacterized protein n=1 Tax=Parelaphostrongylus tenuis TaxID=148309 RepID=A0AAD5M130_PARTN|nr:hypothetical protein KIN20_003260 [Parelaphostrongylus tenuis]